MAGKTVTESMGVGVTVRVPSETLARIDACVAKLEAQNPGLRVTRSNAMLMLLWRGLDQFEGTKSKTRETKG